MRELLRAVVARARKSPFYRSKLPRGTPWEGLPLTTKSDLRAGHPFGFLAVPRSRLATYHESSGTDGAPIASYFTEADWKDIASRFLRSKVGLKGGDLLLIKTPYSMVTTAHQAHFAAGVVGATVVPADNRSTNMPYTRVVSLLHSLGVTVTWSLPTETLLWKLAGARPSRALRALWVAGEPLSPEKRKAISSLWGGVAVVQDYGSTETGSLAGECSRGALHVWGDRVFAEVLDGTTGKCSTVGRGRLVVTPLYREAMPLVRYLLGDEVELGVESCGCPWKYPTLKVLGRAGITVAGRALYPLEIENAVYGAGNRFGLVLWRGRYGREGLRLELHALRETPSALGPFIEDMAERLGVPVTAKFCGLGAFINPRRFKEKLRFSKPRFLFRRGENASRSLDYERSAKKGGPP